MPLVYQQNINPQTKMGVWHIAETEGFFLQQVSLQREISHPHKRLQHLAGRMLLKELYPDFPLELIRVADTRKPYLEQEPFHFSISHCREYAAVIVSREQRVGVDIEIVEAKVGKLISKFLSPEECSLMPRGQINEMATLFWSVKECIFKWDSRGGIDFIRDIRILSFTGDASEGRVEVLFRGEGPLDVHYLHFNGNYLTWVITGS